MTNDKLRDEIKAKAPEDLKEILISMVDNFDVLFDKIDSVTDTANEAYDDSQSAFQLINSHDDRLDELEERIAGLENE